MCEGGTGTVDEGASLVRSQGGGQTRWWTWAGGRANNVLATALSAVDPGLVDELERYDNRYVSLRGGATAATVRSAVALARDRFGDDLGAARPGVSDEALRALKFAELLPPDLASDTLSRRSADHDGTAVLMRRRIE